MNPLTYAKIKSEYDRFYRSLLRKGKLPMWDTGKGFWSAAITDELYEVFKKINLRPSYRFLDLGSGDGKVVLLAALKCKYAAGVEIDESLHNKALEVQKKLKIPNATFIQDDFYNIDFSKYDVLFINPDQPMERGLNQKLKNELKGKLIVFGNFFHPEGLKSKGSFKINDNKVAIYSK